MWHDAGSVAIRVVLAEDSYIVREGLEQVLARAPGVEVVATCADLDALLAAVESERPDVVVTDIRMPPTETDEGIRAAGVLRETWPDVGVVVLSQYDDPAYALALLESGSEGRAYLLKERVHDGGQLAAAVEEVSRGGSVIDSKIVESLVHARAGADSSPLAELTTREREVLAEIAQGKSNSAIAESLVLTKRAVEKHINAIFMKLDLAQADDVSKRVKATLIFLSQADGTSPRGPEGWAHTPPSHRQAPLRWTSVGWNGLSGTRGGRVTHATRERRMSQTDVRVLTVDDQVVFRRVAHDVIVATPGFEPVGDAQSGEDALAEVERLRPELVLLDVRMPGIGGIEAARRIVAAAPETVVVLISIEDSEEFAEDAQACGAAALLRKQDFGPSLLRSIWETHGARV